MKFFVAIALFAAVAQAAIIRPTAVTGQLAEIGQIVQAINSPSTDPATAALLEQMLFETLGIKPEPSPIAVGPALVDQISPIAVGPAFIDFPLPDGGAVTAVEPTPAGVVPNPAVVAPIVEAPVASENLPLVQIIVNVQSGASAIENPVAVVDGITPIIPAPVVLPEVIAPSPVSVVETAPPAVIAPSPVSVVETAPETVVVATPIFPDQVAEPVFIPSPAVILPELVAPEPVQVAEPVIVPTPVVVGTPILPAPAMVLPEILN